MNASSTTKYELSTSPWANKFTMLAIKPNSSALHVPLREGAIEPVSTLRKKATRNHASAASPPTPRARPKVQKMLCGCERFGSAAASSAEYTWIIIQKVVQANSGERDDRGSWRRPTSTGSRERARCLAQVEQRGDALGAGRRESSRNAASDDHHRDQQRLRWRIAPRKSRAAGKPKSQAPREKVRKRQGTMSAIAGA